MGSNPTQAKGLVLFLVAFVLLAGAFAAGGSIILILAALAVLGIAFALFLKCKPWEEQGG